jgi:chromosome segregation ATPase
MQTAKGRVRTLRLDEGPAEGRQITRLLERIDALDAKNGLLRAKLNDARERMAQLESQNRHLRDELLGEASDSSGY